MKKHPSPPSSVALAESGVIRKPWPGKCHVGLIFPQRYGLAMSNLGYQTVYRQFNAFDDVVCERFCLPDKSDGKLRSIESDRPPAAFDMLAFSVSFENDYPHILQLLDRARLPLLANERTAAHPLVVIGGIAAMLNPEPLAPFADIILIGEAEAILPDFMDSYRRSSNRRQFLKQTAETVPGAYLPAAYAITYDAHGDIATVTPDPGFPATVNLARIPDVETIDTSTTVLTADTTFADTCLIEVSRGCPHGCRFCSAGFIYRPTRYRDPAFLTGSIHHAMAHATRVGLVGAAVSDYPDLSTICQQFKGADLRFSFSSLRADALTDDLLQVLKANRTKTATIAPEAGSQRMRNVINKGLTEEDILCAADKIVTAGIPNLKLYFLVGLPTEIEEDIHAIVALCRQIKSVFLDASRRQKRIGTITVHANAFIPKPATPFQWAAMDTVAALQVKARILRNGLKTIANVRFQMGKIRDGYIQAVLSRGDRRVADLLLQRHHSGGNWSQALKQSSLNTAAYVTRQRDRDAILPWDFIETGISKPFLWHDYQKALQGRITPPCPPAGCTRCGACPA